MILEIFYIFCLCLDVTGEIQHSHHLAEQIGQLLLNEDCSDVILIVEGTRFPAHKVILAARSTYFWFKIFILKDLIQ